MKNQRKTPSRSEIVKRIKVRKQKEARKNTTFRFLVEVVEPFQEKCEKAGLSMTQVLEEYMRDFVNN